MSTLSTHILDISTGRPAEGVTASPSREGEMSVVLVTNVQGRIATSSAVSLSAGSYCLIVEAGAWFVRAGRESVFTRAQIDFVIGEATDDHFHLPFLIAPGRWSTYHGNQTRLPDIGRCRVCPTWVAMAWVEMTCRPGKAQPLPGI